MRKSVESIDDQSSKKALRENKAIKGTKKTLCITLFICGSVDSRIRNPFGMRSPLSAGLSEVAVPRNQAWEHCSKMKSAGCQKPDYPGVSMDLKNEITR